MFGFAATDGSNMLVGTVVVGAVAAHGDASVVLDFVLPHDDEVVERALERRRLSRLA